MLQHELAVFFAAADILLGTGVIAARCDKFLSIRCEAHRVDRTVVAHKLAVKDPPRSAALRILFKLPQPHMPAAIPTGQQIAARRKPHESER